MAEERPTHGACPPAVNGGQAVAIDVRALFAELPGRGKMLGWKSGGSGVH